jgi:hypothetical protein
MEKQVHLSRSPYQETSTNVSDGQPNDYGIIAPEQSSDNQTYNAGFEGHQLVKTEDIQYQITTRMGWSSQKDAGDSTTYTYAYLADPTMYYNSTQTNKRYNTFDLSFGIHAQIKDNIFVNALYTGNYGFSGNTHTAMASLEYHWIGYPLE